MSYWDTLNEAGKELDSRAFFAAESAFLAAMAERQNSPGRVFLTEKVADGMRRVWTGLSNQSGAGEQAGRWTAAVAAFRQRYRTLGDETVRDAVRLSEFLPEDGAAANQAVLVAGLFLLTRSELYPPELATAVPLLKAAFRTALHTEQLFAVELVRPDLPLTEEDRLWLARKGDSLLESIFNTDRSVRKETRDSALVSRREWALVLLQLLQPIYFATDSRWEETRHWYEVLLTDRYLGEPIKAITLYQSFISRYPQASDRVASAWVRLLEIPANIGDQYFSVPRYGEVTEALAAGSASSVVESARRHAAAARIVAWRRPLSEPGQAWVSLAAGSDGQLAFVYWWGQEPRDVAFWKPGDDNQALQEFLAPCEGRMIWAESQIGFLLEDIREDSTAENTSGWPVRPFVEALLEAQLPLGGVTSEATRHLAMSQAAAWRSAWDWRKGHPYLAPPRQAAGQPSSVPRSVAAAATTGLLWLAVLDRLDRADPCLRKGIQELAARGDMASAFLVDFREMDTEPEQETPWPWQPWAVPPLQVRPDPLTSVPRTVAVPGAETGPRPDLTGNSVAVVSSGNPAGVLAAWGTAWDRWRVVLDKLDRLPLVAAAAGSGGGLVTLLPRADGVHRLVDATDLLEDLLDSEPGLSTPDDSLLTLFHWTRMVETHNGDLLDFQQVRPQRAGSVPLYDRYTELVADLPREIPPAESGPAAVEDSIWAHQYRERAQLSRLVVGHAWQLLSAPEELDAIWGVSGEDDTAWVFLDSASIHWQLYQNLGESLVDLHQILAERGRGHLSLILGGTFLRDDLDSLLGSWLEPFGSPYYLALANSQAPFLHLATGGVAPDARVLVKESILSQLAHIQDQQRRGESLHILLPSTGSVKQFWHDVAAGSLGLDLTRTWDWVHAEQIWRREGWGWSGESGRLVVLNLSSLAEARNEAPLPDNLTAWQVADRVRADRLTWEKQLCALEVNALLACGAVSVDIADPRWSRRFPLTAMNQESAAVTSAAVAVSSATADSARGYDLPDSPAGFLTTSPRIAEGSSWDEVANTVQRWLMGRGLVHADGYGDPPGCPRPADWPGTGLRLSGVRLHLGGGHQTWYTLARDICQRRESGDHKAWILVIGQVPPAGAVDIVAAHPVPGATCWSPRLDEVRDSGLLSGHDRTGAALVWIQPDQAQVHAVQEAMEAAAPTAVFAGNLRDWLPQAGDAHLPAAASLRWLTRSPVPRVELFCSEMPVAWENHLHRFWAEEVATRGDVVPSGSHKEPTEYVSASGTAVAVARFPAPWRSCPECKTVQPTGSGHHCCPSCGLDVDAWYGEYDRGSRARDLLLAKLQALTKRHDLGRSEALRVWISPEEVSLLQPALKRLGLVGLSTDEGWLVELDGERTWVVAETENSAFVSTPRDHAILFAPGGDLNSLNRLLPRANSVSLWYNASEIDQSEELSPTEKAFRVQHLLWYLSEFGNASMEVVRRTPSEEEWQQRIPTSLLGEMCGLAPQELREILNALRWSTVLAEDATSVGKMPLAADNQSAAQLRIQIPFAEVEYRAQRMGEAMNMLLPLLLATTRPGVPTFFDLNALPVRVGSEELHWLDRFLMASSLRLSYRDGGSESDQLTGQVGSVEELLYEPVAGILFSSRRRLSYLGSVQGVTSCLHHHLDLFLASVKLLLENAERHDEGLLCKVDDGGSSLADPDVIRLGCALGLWSWAGPIKGGALPLDELQSLGRSETVRGEFGISLVRNLATTAARLNELWRRSLPLGILEPLTAQTEDFGAQQMDAISSTEADRIASCILQQYRGMLVLRGFAGSGRVATLVTGLARALNRGQSSHSLTIVCPDVATAVRVHGIWRRVVGSISPPIFLADDTGLVGEGAVDTLGAVTVMVEAHRIPPERRYRISQQARQGALIATVEVGELEEPWDHLFLTTPGEEDVLEFMEQKRQSKKVWQEVRSLLPMQYKLGKTTSRAKGEIHSRWAANLDECLASVVSETERRKLTGRVSLVAPLMEDLTYLGRRLAARGCLPVLRQELEFLQLPGPLEFLAAVSDAAAAESRFLGTGEQQQSPLRELAADGISDLSQEAEVPAPAEQAQPDSIPVSEWSILWPLLTPSVREQYVVWLGMQSADGQQLTIRDVYEDICRSRWAAEFLSPPQARARVERLVNDVGDETLHRFCARPLWEAWRREVTLLAGKDDPDLEGFVVDLSTPEKATGRLAESLIYLCRGTETAKSHYQVLSRCTKRAFVLYQERSPLPSEADSGHS